MAFLFAAPKTGRGIRTKRSREREPQAKRERASGSPVDLSLIHICKALLKEKSLRQKRAAIHRDRRPFFTRGTSKPPGALGGNGPQGDVYKRQDEEYDVLQNFTDRPVFRGRAVLESNNLEYDLDVLDEAARKLLNL